MVTWSTNVRTKVKDNLHISTGNISITYVVRYRPIITMDRSWCTINGLLLKASPAAPLTESKRYEYKQCLKILVSHRPYLSQPCNSLLPVLQRTRRIEATIKSQA